MKEDFVTYEQALALKKLGFHQLCFYNYDASGNFVPNSSMGNEYESITAYDILNCFNEDNNERIDCPTLAQAQKWLKKNKKVDIIVSLEDETYVPYQVEIYLKKKCVSPRYNHGFFETYEEALSAGIDECIKLLEND